MAEDQVRILILTSDSEVRFHSGDMTRRLDSILTTSNSTLDSVLKKLDFNNQLF